MVGKKKDGPIMVFLRQFKDALVIILLVAVTLSAMMGEVGEALTILAIVFCNGVLGFIQEYRTEKTIDSLQKLTAPSCNVIRDGKRVHLPIEKVVPGDLLLFASGDRVAADCRLTKAVELGCDESMLTGESVPVQKQAAPSLDDTAEEYFVRKGTVITGGHGEGVAVATGMDTAMGHIAKMIDHVKPAPSPLQDKLAVMGKQIGWMCIIICFAVGALGILRGHPPMEMVLTAISLAVAAVPEGLPAIVTIALALAMGRMAKRGALIRTLPAVETLGCATVICTDKTGTLTQNKMTVTRIEDGVHRYIPTGDSKAPEWVIRGVGVAALCCNTEDGRENPTESAIVQCSELLHLEDMGLYQNYRRIAEIPFSSATRFMEVTVEDRNGKMVIRKGAPGVVLSSCTHQWKDNKVVPLTEEETRRLQSSCDEMAKQGLRVIGVSCGKEGGPMVYCLWMGISDPLKEGITQGVKACHRAGISVKMVTGDHLLTAVAIGKEAGIYRKGDQAVTGEMLDRLQGTALEKTIRSATVFARVSPHHKLTIVNVLKNQGQIVAMTGDGVNDAPAVKAADMGISMGISGTEVTKETADLILTDDNFATIVSAVEEGRVIYINIRKFIRYLLSCNIGEVLTVFLAMAMGMPVVLLPMQLLLINLVTDGLPALALGIDPMDADVMSMPPRKKKDSLFGNGLLTTILFRGALVGLSSLGAFVSVGKMGGVDAGRTAAFLTLMFTQLVHVFECKSERLPLHSIPFWNNIRLILAALLSAVIGVGAAIVPILQTIFSFVNISAAAWLNVAAWTFLGPVVSEIFFALRQNKNASHEMTVTEPH